MRQAAWKCWSESIGSWETKGACSEICQDGAVPSLLSRIISAPERMETHHRHFLTQLPHSSKDFVLYLETQDKTLEDIHSNLPSFVAHKSSERKDGRKEGRGRRKKAAPADSCVPPPLLLHWSGGGLSDLLKGTDQNNCSVQENTSHSSPRTPLWLHSNSTLLHMTDGSRALSLSSPLFCRGGWGRGRWRWRWGRLETTEERYSFDLILICPRHQEQPQE